MSKQFCLQTMRTAAFLEYRPSTIAAACVLLAIKLNSSKLKPSGKQSPQRSTSAMSGYRSMRNSNKPEFPLTMWNAEVEQLTGLSLI